jgi:hypothetical protein
MNKSPTNLKIESISSLVLIHEHFSIIAIRGSEKEEGNEEIRIICFDVGCTLQLSQSHQLHSIMWNKLEFFRQIFSSISRLFCCCVEHARCVCVCVSRH